LTTDPAQVWPDGSARLNYQQYTDWQLGNRMAQSGQVHCTTCHAVHGDGVAASQLRAPLNDLCLQCHNDQRALIEHTPFHEQAIANGRHEFTCADCHMPKLATSAVPFDLHNHTFQAPNPQASIDHGSVALMPNACNRCHTDYGEDPQWAVQTIAYAATQARPNASEFFGPGPTPTSPPPPTPISVVGQPVQRVEVQTGQWLRTTVIALFWLFVAAVVVWIVYTVRSRRLRNV
jgi:predicted CXXCH cytochrome family protein